MDLETLLTVAEAHLARMEIAAARAVADRATSIAGGDPRLANLRGRIEEADNRFGAARDFFEAAVKAAPRNANFRASLAQSFIHTGDFDRARAELDVILEMSPYHSGALQLYALISKVGRDDDFVGRVQSAIDFVGPESQRASKLYFALGKALDDRREYDDAFAAFRRANDLRRFVYSPGAHESVVRRVKEVWPHERIAQMRRRGFESREPVFIIGMPRSGSTLLQQRLAADPRVEALGEAGDIAAISAAMERNHPRRAAYPEWCAEVPDDAWRGLGQLYVANARSRRPGASLYVNKNLFNWLFGGFIMASLPNAFLVEIRRNAIDACLSCYFTDLHEAHNYAVRLDAIAHMYSLCVELIAHWRGARDIPVVRYEDLVDDAPFVVAKLLSAMELAEGDAGAGETAPPTQTFSSWQVRQPIYAHSVERWRNYEKHLGPLIEALGDLAG